MKVGGEFINSPGHITVTAQPIIPTVWAPTEPASVLPTTDIIIITDVTIFVKCANFFKTHAACRIFLLCSRTVASFAPA